MMNLLHEHVHHSQFGDGTVTNQTENVVEVEFGGEYGSRKFIYPSAFEKFLTLDDPKSHGEMDNELQKAEAARQAEKQRRIDEMHQRAEDERQAALEKKRTAAKKRSTAKKA